MASGNPIVVVGAGAQGLTFALEAARRGLRVILVEGSSQVGGQARSLRYRNFSFDFGMHAFVSRNPRVLERVKSYLGDDYSCFRPRAASWLKEGVIVEDSSAWSCQDDRRALHRLFPLPPPDSWNCMLIQEPPKIVYPRRGGFGRLFENMAAALRTAGGKIVFDVPLCRADFEIEGRTLRAIRIKGRRTLVTGCYWSAGGRALADAPRLPAQDGSLLFYHFLLKGRAPLPYHWIRISTENPFIPPLVYYPARFSADNAPAGCYSLGAAIPAAPAADETAARRALMLWHGSSPEAFAPFVRRFLADQGFIRDRDVLAVHQERFAAPLDRLGCAARHPFRDVRNFWDSDVWLADGPGESGVPLQMAAALRAWDEVSERGEPGLGLNRA